MRDEVRKYFDSVESVVGPLDIVDYENGGWTVFFRYKGRLIQADFKLGGNNFEQYAVQLREDRTVKCKCQNFAGINVTTAHNGKPVSRLETILARWAQEWEKEEQSPPLTRPTTA